MLTCSLASPVPMILAALLLLAASLSAHHGTWDNPTCTEANMTVPRGGLTVMACNISNNFTDVTIKVKVHGKEETIFKETSAGRFSRDGWQLQVQGGQAQLVIEDVQDTHAGQYLWHLNGLQRNDKNFSLRVSEPQGPEETAPEELSTFSRAPADQEPDGAPVTVTIFSLLGLTGLIIGGLIWYRHRRGRGSRPRRLS